jgi:hypothetical protein
MSRAWALRSFRWCYCAFIAYVSAQTYVGAHGDLHALILSSVEFAAVLLFLIEPLEIVAGAALLVVFAIATAITAARGEIPIRFLYFAGTTAYIVFAHRSERLALRRTDGG